MDHIRPKTATVQRITLPIEGLTRNHHAAEQLEYNLARLHGVQYVFVGVDTEMAYLLFDPNLISIHDLLIVIKQAGFVPGDAEQR